jgi:hypothetical protein
MPQKPFSFLKQKYIATLPSLIYTFVNPPPALQWSGADWSEKGGHNTEAQKNGHNTVTEAQGFGRGPSVRASGT